MKTLLLILFALTAVAADVPLRTQPTAPYAGVTNRVRWREIKDLGVITDTSLIELVPCERRKDFGLFKIEIMPRNLRGWTNKVTFTTTNTFLKIDDLAAVPEGVAIMGVRSYCTDGTPSPLSLFRIEVARGEPDAPDAKVSHILKMHSEQKLEHMLDAIANEPGPQPPMPPGMTNSGASVPMPLPGGEGLTYVQYQKRLEDAALHGRRRSQ